jgi:hypothetical protein
VPPAHAVTTVPAQNGLPWDICDKTGGCGGAADSGAIQSGGNAFATFGYLGDLSVYDAQFNYVASSSTLTGLGLTHDGGRRWATTTPVDVGGVEVSRALYAPIGTNLLRYVDTFHNTTTERRRVDVDVTGILAAGPNVEIAASGGQQDTLDDLCSPWAAIRDKADAANPVGFAFVGLNPRRAAFDCADIDTPSAEIEVNYEVELEPGESVSLAYFVVLGLVGNPAEVDLVAATARALPTAPPFGDLSLAEKIALGNWGVPERIATGPGPGSSPDVRLFDVNPATGVASQYTGFLAFDPGFAGGVSVAAAGRTVVAGAGPGGGPEVRAFYPHPETGAIGTSTGFRSVMFYPPTFPGGVQVACSSYRWDPGLCSTVGAAPGAGGTPHVRLFWGDLSEEQVGFLPYDPLFHGPVNLALGQFTYEEQPYVVTAPGPGGAPHVRVYRQQAEWWPPTVSVMSEFFAYDPGLIGGVTVAVGDVLGTGTPQIITGTGPGGAPHIKVFTVDPETGAVAAVGPGFFAYPPGFIGGAWVAVANVDGTGPAELITGTGSGGAPHVRIWRIDPATGAPTEFGPGFFAYDPAFLGGVKVSGGFHR